MTCINADNKDKIITFLTINTSSYSSSIMVLNDKNTITYNRTDINN